MNAAAEAIPVVISQSAFGWTAGGVWTGVFILLGVLVRFGPALAKLIFDRNAQKETHAHQSSRDNFHDCQEQLRETNARLDMVIDRYDKLQQAFITLKAETQGAIAGYKLLEAEVEATNPQSLALRQARIMLGEAFRFNPPTPEIQAAAERAVETVIRLDATAKDKRDGDQS